MDILLNGNIPNGSGLSSSASVEVLTGFILRDLFGFEVTNQDFTDQVHLSICTKEADTARFIEEMAELCYGRIVFCEEKTIFECKNL